MSFIPVDQDRVPIGDEDDWSGVTDSRRRRKIQNRINQRNRRQRNRQGDDHAVGHVQAALAPSPATSHLLRMMSDPNAPIQPRDLRMLINTVDLLEPPSAKNQAIIQAFETFAYRRYMAASPMTTILPILMQYHVIRAFKTNVEIMGLPPNQMHDDALSPFNVAGPWPHTVTASLSSLPVALQPTSLQRRVEHHPWIDLLPSPQLRDNLFERGLDNFDEGDLCRSIRGRNKSQNPGVIVWKNPWDASGWEISEEFAKCWAWVIKDCWDIYRSTNIWRAQRGEKPLFVSIPE